MNPIFLMGIYGSGVVLSVLLGISGDVVFASGAVSNVSSAIVSYHAWCCTLFGLMLIFKTKDLWINAMAVSVVDPVGSINDRVGLQLTQICGIWVLAYALLSYSIVFFVPNAGWYLFVLHLFAIFAQGGEVVIKVISNGKFGRGPLINSHHCIVQIIGILFLVNAL